MDNMVYSMHEDNILKQLLYVDNHNVSFHHSDDDTREWLSSKYCYCWMATGMTVHSFMPLKVTLHPPRQDLAKNLVVWM